jgi:hypothetical protein
MIELRAAERVTGRPFAAPAWTTRDEDVLRGMWDRLRAHVRDVKASEVVSGAERRTQRFDRETGADGSVHTMVLPSLPRAFLTADLFGVGFFGQARQHVDHSPIMELERALIADMPTTPGLVAYYNAFDPTAGWGNLVLFEDHVVERAWGGDPRHVEAVRRSPDHYRSIRLHHARAVGGLLGSGPIEITRTRYIDYADDPPWRAVRERKA